MYAFRKGWLSTPAAAVSVWAMASAALAADAKSAEDWFREGIDAMQAGKLPDAIQDFQYCTQLKPDLKECWFNLGVAYGRQRDFSREATAYLEAVRLDPAYGRAHFNLAVAYEDLGRPADALKHYDLALQAEPNAIDAHLNRAMLLLSLDRYDESIAGFEKAVQLQPEAAEGYYDLAEAQHIKAGKLQEPERTQWLRKAISTYQLCLGKDPNHYRSWYNIGVIHHKLKDLDSEIAAYQKTLALKSKYTPALYNLAFALRDKGDKPAAKAAFEAYVAAAGTAKQEARFVEIAKREIAKL
ncbi:MAG: tetratricopeptide repeat protein [Deltaproteobacteria bacterium]|nr:tetratricopeptide repeat protein [Deltaproteobacteria bacterium]